MALHIGDAFIRILVQMEGLVKGMREAESITRQSAAGMQSALDGSTASMQQLEQAAQQTRSAAGWLGAALGGLAAAGMVTMKGIAGTAMRTQELGIVLEVVARNAGVAGETTAKLEAEMKDLGMTTQAARTIITRMIQTNVDLSRATQLVRVAQDMAVISMEDSSTAAQGLMRAIVTMNPILLRKYGIMTGLEDIDRRAGEALGILTYETEKSGKTVKKWAREITAAERQQAIFNMILEEGGKFAGTYTDAMEAPGKAMRSFSRYIMEAQEAVGEYWLPILNQAVGVATKLVKAFNEAPPSLKRFIAIALPVGTALASLAGSALILYSQWGRILPVIKGVAALLSGLAAPVAAAIAVVAALGAAWHFNWFGIQEKTATAVTAIRGYLDDLLAIIQSTFEAEGMLGVIELFGEQLYSLIEHVFGVELANRIALKITEFGTTITDQLQIVGESLAIVSAELAPFLSEALGHLGAAIDEAAQGWIEGAESGIGGLRGAFEAGLPEVAAAVSALGEGLQAAWDIIWESFPEPVQTAIEDIIATLESLLATISEKVTPVVEGIGHVLGTLADTILPPLEAAFQSIQDTISTELEPTLDSLRELWIALGPVVETLAQILGGAIVVAIGVLSSLVTALATAFAASFDDIMHVVQSVIQIITGILETFAGTIEWLTGLITGNLEKQEAGWQKMKDGLEKIVEGLRKAVISAFTGMVDFVTTLVGSFVENIWQFFNNLYNRLVGSDGTVPTLMEHMKDIFSDKLAEVIAIIVTAITDMISAFTNRVSDFFSAGAAIVDGLIAGVKSKIGSLIAAAKDAVSRAIQAAKDALGIGSESQVFYEIGLGMAEGLIAAFKDSKPEVIEAVAEVIEDVIESMRDAAIALVEMVKALEGADLSLDDFKKLVDRLIDDIEYILKAIRTRLLELWGWSGARANTVWGHMISWAESVGAVMSVIGTAVETFTLLRKYKGLMPMAIDNLVEDIELVLTKLAEIALLFETEGLDVTLEFAMAAGAILEGISRAIQPLLDLADFAPDQATMRAGIDNFFASLEYFLDEFAWGMWRWEDLASEKTVEIAERMGQIMSGISEAIQPLLDIAEYAPDQAAFRTAVSLFFANLEYFLDEFAWGMWRFEDLAGEKSVEIAGLIGRTLGGLGEAIQPLLDVAEYSITPGEAERSARLFFQSLEIFLDTFAWEAEKLDANIDPALTELAETIGALVSGIGEAVGPLMDLGRYGFVEKEYKGITYKAWLNLEEVQQSFDMFFLHLGIILADFEEASKEWEVSDAGQILAEAIGKLVSNLGEALTFLTNIAEYGAETSQAATRGFQTFLRDIKRILSDLEEANETMGPALVAAEEFALTAADVLSKIQEAINDLNSLGKLEEMPDLVEAGINLIKSLEDGMISQAFKAAQTAIMAVEFVINAIIVNCNYVWGPQLFAAGIGLGSTLIDGMIAGLIAQEGALYATIARIIQSAIAAGNAAAGAVPAGLGGLALPAAGPGFAAPVPAVAGVGTHHHYELEYHAHREELGEEDAARAMKLIEFRNRWR